MTVIIKPPDSLSRQHLTVQCPCGRALRAKIELAGTEIPCWECHRKVLVPFPRSAGEVIHALRQGWDDVFETPLFRLLIGVAVVFTAVLAVPRWGVALGAVGFVLAAFGYGALIRRVGDAGVRGEDRAAEADEPAGPRRWLARGGAALLFGIGLSAPFLLARGGIGQPARFAGVLVPLLAVAVFGLWPLVMLAAFGPSGPRAARAIVRWRWRSALGVLALVPLTLVVLECMIVFTSFFLGFFGGLMIDLVPTPPGLRERLGVAPDWIYHFGEPADIHFLDVYFNRLCHGYTLTGAIPPSLMLPASTVDKYWATSRDADLFFIFQVAFTALIHTCVLSAFALQACWLARIGQLESGVKVRPVAERTAVGAGTV